MWEGNDSAKVWCSRKPNPWILIEYVAVDDNGVLFAFWPHYETRIAKTA
jgi:hypothetical protein